MTYKLIFNKQLINYHIFLSVDVKKNKVQLGYKNLKNKKMDITVNSYLFQKQMKILIKNNLFFKKREQKR